MKTKLRYNHAAYFGNFDIDALEAYLPREIEVEQNEEFEHLEVDLELKSLVHNPTTHARHETKITFCIEGKTINLYYVGVFIDAEDRVKDILEYYSLLVTHEITLIINEQFSNMVDAIKGNQENEIEKQKTEEFIRHNF